MWEFWWDYLTMQTVVSHLHLSSQSVQLIIRGQMGVWKLRFSFFPFFPKIKHKFLFFFFLQGLFYSSEYMRIWLDGYLMLNQCFINIKLRCQKGLTDNHNGDSYSCLHKEKRSLLCFWIIWNCLMTYSSFEKCFLQIRICPF